MEYIQNFYLPIINLDKYTQVTEKVEKLFPDYVKTKINGKKYKKNITMYIVNLILSNGNIAVLRNSGWFQNNFKHSWHSKRIAVNSQDILEEKGFIEIELGYKAEGFKTGFATVLKVTEKFKEEFKDIKTFPIEIDKMNFHDLSIKLDNDKYIEIKLTPVNCIPNPSTEDKSDLMPIYSDEEIFGKNESGVYVLPFFYSEYIDNDEIESGNMLEEVNLGRDILEVIKEVEGKDEDWEEEEDGDALEGTFESIVRQVFVLNNSYFKKIKLSFNDDNIEKKNILMIRDVYLTRMFSKGINHFGRFNQRGGQSYQNIEKEDRAHLLINEKETIEVDYKTLHPNLLYTMKGIQNNSEDIYLDIVKDLIGKEDDELRTAIKIFMLVLINAKSYNSYVLGINNSHSDKLAIVKSFGKTHLDVKDAVIKVCPELKEYFHSNKSTELMKLDSTLMNNVLFKLKNTDILGIPLHDSIICQKGNEHIVKTIMEEEYTKLTGFNIGVDYK
jgi:hypothetical protein